MDDDEPAVRVRPPGEQPAAPAGPDPVGRRPGEAAARLRQQSGFDQLEALLQTAVQAEQNLYLGEILRASATGYASTDKGRFR